MAVKDSKVKSRRPRSEKSKTGCLTCRIRHVKCDEARPRCRKCTDTGRHCDGPTVHDFRFVQERVVQRKDRNGPGMLPIETRRLLLFPQAAGQELRAFDYFLHRVVPPLSGIFHSGFWSCLVPQMALSYPWVWNATLAFSTLFEHGVVEVGPTTSHDGRRRLGTHHRQALGWYNKAITGFNEHAQHDPPDSATALLSCIIFTAIEFSQKEVVQALSLLQNGFTLLSKTLTSSELARASSTSSAISDVVVPFFSRQALVMATFGQPTLPDTPQQAKSTAIEQASSDHFVTVEEARTALKTLMYHGNDFLRLTLLLTGDTDALANLRKRQRVLLSRYSKWHNKLAGMSVSLVDSSPETTNVLSSLLVYYGTTLIWLSTCLSATQTSFDRYIPLFRVIVKHANTALISATHLEDVIFNNEMDLIPPLYFVTTKCREPRLRREALVLLRAVPCKENAWLNLWAVLPTVRIAEKIIELEEADLQGTALLAYACDDYELPDETARIHDVEVLQRNSRSHNVQLAIKALRFNCNQDGSRSIREQIVEI